MLDVIVGTCLISAGILWITYIYRRSLTFEPLGKNQAVRLILRAAQEDRINAAKQKEDL